MGNIFELSKNVYNNTNSVGLDPGILVPVILDPVNLKNNNKIIPYNTYNKIFIIPDSLSSDELIKKFKLNAAYTGGTKFFTNEDHSFIMLVIIFDTIDFVPTFMGYFDSKINVVLLCPDKARYGISKEIFAKIERLIKRDVSYIPASIL